MRTIKTLFIAAALALTASAGAETYPARPIRVIVAYPPGGSTDIIARIIGPKLTERLGQPVVVDNRAGAAGMIGASIAAQATPDGHTLILSDSPFVVNPSIFAKVPYDPIRDFTPIVLVAYSPVMLVVTASVPAQNFAEFLKLGKTLGPKLTIGSAGIGASSHVVAELFKMRAGINATHVPYKGLGPALQEVAGGQVHSVFSSIPAAMPFVKSGRLRALGVAAKSRVTAAPDVPTIGEGGIADFEAGIWYGYQGPAHMPKAVVTRLAGEISKIVSQPEVKERFLGMGLEQMTLMPQEFGPFIRTDMKKWADVVKAANIKAE